MQGSRSSGVQVQYYRNTGVVGCLESMCTSRVRHVVMKPGSYTCSLRLLSVSTSTSVACMHAFHVCTSRVAEAVHVVLYHMADQGPGGGALCQGDRGAAPGGAGGADPPQGGLRAVSTLSH